MNADRHYRTPTRIVNGIPVSDGRGVKLYRLLGQPGLMEVDPFLLLDEFKSDKPSDYIGGFPDHPHRGFQTVTYMLAGRMRHQDNKGHEGVLGPGGVQWMNAGRGIVHSEMPEQENGLLHGFQLWINLPAKEKMSDPFYFEFSGEEIPTIELPGQTLRVIAGTGPGGQQGVVRGVTGNPLYLDFQLEPMAEFDQTIVPSHQALVSLFQGTATVRSERGERKMTAGQLAVFPEEGTAIRLVAGDSGCRGLLLACEPIRETVVRHGPFVMNSEEEIRRAVQDYSTGKF